MPPPRVREPAARSNSWCACSTKSSARRHPPRRSTRPSCTSTEKWCIVAARKHLSAAPSPRPTRPPRRTRWSWDCTSMGGPIKGQYYYLVMLLDIYSRKITGWEISLAESAHNSRTVLERAVLSQQIMISRWCCMRGRRQPLQGCDAARRSCMTLASRHRSAGRGSPMITPTRRRCFAPVNTGLATQLMGSPRSTTPVSGWPASCSGTTTSIRTAGSAW